MTETDRALIQGYADFMAQTGRCFADLRINPGLYESLFSSPYLDLSREGSTTYLGLPLIVDPAVKTFKFEVHHD